MTNRSMTDPAELMVQGQRQFAHALAGLFQLIGAWFDRTLSKVPPTEPHQP
jgi:hypothetical protein